jgi:hypothetical protein
LVYIKTMRLYLKKTIVVLVMGIALTVLWCSAHAQKPSIQAPPAKDAIRPNQQEAVLDDPLGRSTPLGTVLGFMKSVDKEDYERAVEYILIQNNLQNVHSSSQKRFRS